MDTNSLDSNGTDTQAYGLIAPGDASVSSRAVGRITAAGLSLNSPHISLTFDLAAPGAVGNSGSDFIDVSGPVTFTGNGVTIEPLAGFGVGAYTLIRYAPGDRTGALNLIGAPPSSLLNWGLDYSTGGQVNLVVTRSTSATTVLNWIGGEAVTGMPAQTGTAPTASILSRATRLT